MATEAWTERGRRLDARRFTDKGWNRLCHRVRGGMMALHCERCATPLRPRQGVELLGRRRHFFHPAGVPRSCTNVDQEGESDAHRDLKSTLAAAYETVPGLTAVKEFTLLDADGNRIRPDVAVHRGLEVVSLSEVQTSTQPLDVLIERDKQRRSALRRLDSKGFATGATPWFTTRVVASHYHKFPMLYLSMDGQRVTDGVYELHRFGGPDLDKPVELDIDAFCHAQINHQLDEIADEGAWIDRRHLAAGQKIKRGKRRKLPEWRPERNIECRRPEPEEVAATANPSHTSGASTHVLAASMQGKWHRPPAQPWAIELASGPYRGCIVEVYKLGPYMTVIGEHGRAGYARDDTATVEPYTYRFDKVL